jgi:hypothetical protein
MEDLVIQIAIGIAVLAEKWFTKHDFGEKRIREKHWRPFTMIIIIMPFQQFLMVPLKWRIT